MKYWVLLSAALVWEWGKRSRTDETKVCVMAVKLDACTHPVYGIRSELFPQVTFISRLLAGSQILVRAFWMQTPLLSWYLILYRAPSPPLPSEWTVWTRSISLPSSKMCLNCRTEKNNYSFTAVGNFCTTVGLMGTDSGQLYLRRKIKSTAVDNIAHEIDYGLEFCWLSVPQLQQLIAVITAAVLHLFGRCAWRHSALRSWWSILRMRTATLILWYVCMYVCTQTHSLMDYWSHCNPLKSRHYSLN